MKRLALVALLCLPLVARAFTLINFATSPATPLVYFECHGNPQTGATTESNDFVPRFLPYGQFGLDGGGTFFGTDSYQFDTISCGWGTAGTVSGGTDVMRMQLIQKSDAGVVCSCDLPGACNDAAGSEHTCSCGGIKYLLGLHALGQGYACQLNSATNCGGNPQGFRCAIPFRK
jgi:hypothetical protein